MERYVIRGGRAGYERLEVLSRACLPETSALVDRVGVAPGTRCLDLGCGSGDETFELARRSGPGGHVTYSRVLERQGGDPETARKLYRHFLEAGIPNARLSVRQGVHATGEATALPLSTVEATGEAIVSEGIATQAELEAVLADLAAFTAPTTIIGRPRTSQIRARRDP